MIRAFLQRLPRRRGGASLMRMLTPLVLFAVATTVLFAMINGDTADERALSLVQRLGPARLWAQLNSSATEILLLITLMMLGVYLTLHIGLRPLRRMSQ